MSEHSVAVTPEQQAKDTAFLQEQAQKPTERYIKRHSKLARFTHDVVAISCILLCITGLFVFVPPLTELAGQKVVFAMRMAHRVLGVIFVAIPIISAIAAPKGVVHTFKNLFAKWNADDKKWMILFFPYLFFAKWVHMPDQDETKSGQRFADGMMWLFAGLMGVTGVLLMIGSTVADFGSGYGIILFLHDLGFFFLAIFGLAHIFLGAGIFQPYRGTHRLMFGDGVVSESDALYHWGHWARKEISSGENVVEK